VETKQSVSNQTQATRHKSWHVCISQDSNVQYLVGYKQLNSCMVIHWFIFFNQSARFLFTSMQERFSLLFSNIF
jgi:hypothetical protein